jgi:hypothetical protein
MDTFFHFNTIYIIESLSDNEKQTGEILYNDIIKRSSERTGLHHTKLLKLETKEAFFKSFETINEYTLKGFHPFIHFEVHGSERKNGLVLKSGEIVLWKELADLTRQINVITKNNLVITLATCYGAYFLTEIKALDGAPFCGCVSTTGLLYEDEIITRFTIFFETLFDQTNFDLAVERLNTTNELGYKFKFLTAEEFFDDLVDKMTNENFNPKHIEFRTWVNRLVKKLQKNQIFLTVPEKKLKEIAREQIIKKGETFKAEFKKSFLLND